MAALPRESIEKLIEEAESCLKRGDHVQASEKLYKAAEEAIKALAAIHELPERDEALKRGRWTAALLFSAVERLSGRIGPEVRAFWDHAWFLHVEGFHEARLNVELVRARARYVKELVELAQEA